MASTFERYLFALGKAARAMKNSAAERSEPEPPVAPTPPQSTAIIELVRCPRCGNYAPAGQACRCT